VKPLSVGGKHDLESFKNRLGRAYGQGLIDAEQFTRMSKKVEELLKELESIRKKE
jgi:hypothetical protein